MLCLVSQPNSVILEVEVDSKAKGKECLDKICDLLGIIESDYMGLQYVGPHNDKLWLNLRNQIRRQLPGPPPFRLYLRVKFFVPPHLILQDITRHLFYLDVRQAFLENKLRTRSTQQLCRLAALQAQAELGDLDPAGRSEALLTYPRFLPTQCPDADQTQPQRLRVRWRSGGHSDEDEGLEEDESARVSIETDRTAVARVCQGVLREHAALRGTVPHAAVYLFLKETAALEDFGMEQYFVKNRGGETLRVGVGPAGVLVHDLDLRLKHSITYASIHLATHTGRCFLLTYVNNTGHSQGLGFKLESCHAASALYRAVTEKHAFYSCETVRNAVTSQFIRDLKGTIASLFNENTALGKNYVFDIQRTCREVYDHTRRVMYQMETKVKKENTKNSLSSTLKSVDDISEDENADACLLPSCKRIQEQLAAFQDSMLCRVCMDADVSTVFFPCRHVACCSTCAPLCKSCPLCRSDIVETQHIYLPYTGHDKIAQFEETDTSQSVMS